MRIIKFTLLIPLRYNDGRKVPRRIVGRILADIFSLVDGWTYAGEVTGAYRMKDGSQQIDEHRCYWVNVPRGKIRAFTRLVGKIGALLGQEFMYLERSDGKVQLIPPWIERENDEDVDETNPGRTS